MPERVRPAAVAEMTGLSLRSVQQHAAELISLPVAARVTGLPLRQFRREAEAGHIHGAEFVGGEWWFVLSHVKHWIKRRDRETILHAKMAANKGRYCKPRKPRTRELLSHDNIVSISIPVERSGCGIYFLIKDRRVVYVGQSVAAHMRVSSHLTAGRDFDSWSFVPCPKKSLNKLERAYIDCLMPALNRDGTTAARRRIASNG